MARGLARPDHVAEVSGRMVEGIHLQARVMRTGDKRVARSETGAENPELRIALCLQPVDGGADIGNPLARRGQSPANIGRDSIVGALEFRRAAYVVIRHAEPQAGDAEPV